MTPRSRRPGRTLTLLPVASQAERPERKSSQEVDSLVLELSVTDWSRVQAAKRSLESLQASAVPALLSMMNDRKRVPLTDTADLIYPGAKTFYGHGFVVDYDLDSLAVRAGWVLEAITFQDFGFRAGQIDHDKLLEDTAQHGFEDRPVSSVAPVRAMGTEEIDGAILAAMKWWNASAKEWSRLGGLEQALSSTSVRRQIAAFQYLRFGETECDGLSTDSFEARLLPLVNGLAITGAEEVKVQAAYLIRSGWRRK